MLRVRDRRLENLQNRHRRRTRRVSEYRTRLVDRLSADVVHDQARLARRASGRTWPGRGRRPARRPGAGGGSRGFLAAASAEPRRGPRFFAGFAGLGGVLVLGSSASASARPSARGAFGFGASSACLGLGGRLATARLGGVRGGLGGLLGARRPRRPRPPARRRRLRPPPPRLPRRRLRLFVLLVGSSSSHLRLVRAGVTAEVAGGRELAELVADHRLGDEHRACASCRRGRRSCGRPSRGRSSRHATRCGPSASCWPRSSSSMRFIRRSSTHGPFLAERLIGCFCPSCRDGGRGRCSGPTPCSSCACGSRASACPTG